MAEAADPKAILRKRKAINALLPYSIRLVESGQQRMADTLSYLSEVSNPGEFAWHCIQPLMAAVFDRPSTPSLDRVITLVSPYLDWDNHHFNQDTVTRWSTAALAVPYTEEVGRSVVNALWRIASVDALRQHIPVNIWSWSNNKTFIPPAWLGGYIRTQEVVRQVRALGDKEILKSYLLLVWLDWRWLGHASLAEMCAAITEDLNGIGMGHHREDLIKRLDHALKRDLGYPIEHRPDLNPLVLALAKGEYQRLKEVLLEVDEAIRVLYSTSSGLIIHFDLLTSVDTCRISLDIHV